MSDIFGIFSGQDSSTKQACRVAYTLNNTQPVACTIIGDQPLFYMDYECDYEDEGFLDDFELGILESEISALQNEIESLDKFSQEFRQDSEELFQDFLDDKELITASSQKDEASIEILTETLSHSRLAQAYLDFAAEHNVKVKLSGQVQDAEYDRKSGTIFVNAQLSLEDQVLLTVRELRRHWQHRQGALIHPLMFHPDNAILINRMQVADLLVSMIRVAWELQLSNHKAAWERIENSSMADLGRAFARESFLDFRSINNGLAAAAVVETWFLSERCREEDKNLIQQMLADYQGYVFDMDEAEQSVTPALISALGTMPYGKNYLAQHIHTLMNDPIFTDVRDRSNANFLWFIKFERSFRETEQELQIDHGAQADGIQLSAPTNRIQDQLNGEAEDAEIVTLFSDDPEAKETGNDKKLLSKSKKPKGENSGAKIIYLRRWSGE